MNTKSVWPEENELAKMFALSRTGVILKGDYAKWFFNVGVPLYEK